MKGRFVQSLFALERKPRKGLFAFEWAVLAYLALTLAMIFFAWTKLANPEAMVMGRVRVAAAMALLWGAYRLLPCRLTAFARVAAQMAFLSWWYPDTYELNRILPNLDHFFAAWEEAVFRCQPALIFHRLAPHPVFSELMDLGYASYFPMIAITVVFHFAARPKDALRAAYVIMAAFFAYYVIYVFLPVTGPQYYYLAIGFDNARDGVFPALGDYFNRHAERAPNPGWPDGVFYQMVCAAHAAGERPTAAFPSSHVGISTVLMLLAARARSRGLFFAMLPLFALMCLSTVYIQAHYAIDVLAGLATGALFYLAFDAHYNHILKKKGA